MKNVNERWRLHSTNYEWMQEGWIRQLTEGMTSVWHVRQLLRQQVRRMLSKGIAHLREIMQDGQKNLTAEEYANLVVNVRQKANQQILAVRSQLLKMGLEEHKLDLLEKRLKGQTRWRYVNGTSEITAKLNVLPESPPT
jgi:hypothetical protein